MLNLVFGPVSISEPMCNFEVYIRQFQHVNFPFLLTTLFVKIKYNKSNTKGFRAIVLCGKKMYTAFYTISVLLAWYKFYLHFVAINWSLWTKDQYPRSNALREKKKMAPLAEKSPKFRITHVILTVTRTSQRSTFWDYSASWHTNYLLKASRPKFRISPIWCYSATQSMQYWSRRKQLRNYSNYFT